MAEEEEKDSGKPSEEDLARIKDTNVEGIGSKENRDLRKAAAETEKAWKGAGAKKGKQVWRIEKFKVVPWPKEKYGTFFSGDSFIILNTMIDKTSGKKTYDVYFWLGNETTQDEAGTAAYKTVELDDLLGDEPVQYREVQGNESQQFLDLWKTMHVLDGGIESGFNKVKAKEYKPRLMHITGYKKHVQVFQVPLKVKSLNHHDSFVLDLGLILYQFNGNKASGWEKRKANEEVQAIRGDRHGKVKENHIIDGLKEENEDSKAFWKLFGGKPESIKATEQDGDDKKEDVEAKATKCMLKVSDEDGEMSVTKVCDGYVDKDKLESDDAFIIDFGVSIYIWVGKGANKAEHKEAMVHAVQYLNSLDRDTHIPMCRVLEGKEPKHFHKLMATGKKALNAANIPNGFMGRRDSNPVLSEVAAAADAGAAEDSGEEEAAEE